jgi:hypothetical protein
MRTLLQLHRIQFYIDELLAPYNKRAFDSYVRRRTRIFVGFRIIACAYIAFLLLSNPQPWVQAGFDRIHLYIAGVETRASVTRLLASTTYGKNTVIHTMDYRYTVNEQTFHKTIGISAASYATLKIGQKIAIVHSPDNPKRVVSLNFDESWILSVAPIFFAPLFLAEAVLLGLRALMWRR